MKYANVNTNYEGKLFEEEAPLEKKLNPRETRLRWEFIFFYLNQSSEIGLSTDKVYSQAYLEFLREHGLVVPKFTKKDGDFQWFGALTNIEVEKKLNSKIWTYQLLEKLGLPVKDLFIVNSEEDAKEIIRARPEIDKWFIKSPYRSSGGRMAIIESPEDIESFNYPHILEPYKERLIDLVYHYDPATKKSFAYISRPSPDGGYRGGIFFQDETLLETQLAAKGLLNSFNILKNAWSEIMKEVLKEPLKQPLTIDSFLYREDNQNKVYPMCEINYRVNIGTFLDSLRRFVPEHGIGELVMLKPPRGRSFRERFQYDKKSKVGILQLNDDDGPSSAVLLCADSLKTLAKLRILLNETFKGMSFK